LNFPKPYPSQFEFRGESLTCYGSDFRDAVTYQFNDQGYRSDHNFDINSTTPTVACLGSSIATGHGLELEQCFGAQVARHLGYDFWNLGQGCFRSSNQTIAEQIEYLVNSTAPTEFYIIQFTHINRQGSKSASYLEFDQNICVNNFVEILQKTTTLLKDKKWCWLLMDWSGAEFPQSVLNHPNKIAIDPDIVDHVSVAGYEHLAPSTQALRLLSLHPGPLWHQDIANQIIDFYNNYSKTPNPAESLAQ
jgi:hypothetical protein